MNYEDLIEKLREKDGCNCECLQAAGAIEALLAERDAAVEDLRTFRTCSTCANAEENSGRGKPCAFGPVCTGQYWQWRGQQKGD